MRYRSSNPQPHLAVLPHLRRFETPDLAQPGGWPQEALGTGWDTTADYGLAPTHLTEDLAWPGTQEKKKKKKRTKGQTYEKDKGTDLRKGQRDRLTKRTKRQTYEKDKETAIRKGLSVGGRKRYTMYDRDMILPPGGSAQRMVLTQRAKAQ